MVGWRTFNVMSEGQPSYWLVLQKTARSGIPGWTLFGAFLASALDKVLAFRQLHMFCYDKEPR